MASVVEVFVLLDSGGSQSDRLSTAIGCPIVASSQTIEYTQRVENGRTALWTMVGVAVGFKLFGAALILFYDHSQAAWAFIAATHWPFVVPAVLLLGPLLYWWRLLRVRTKRRQLIAAEWHEGDLPAPSSLDR
ncbi:MAG: hypothetical protein U0556_10525 [Dehalococcoidia bacterium]